MTKKELEKLKDNLKSQLRPNTVLQSTEEITKRHVFNLGVLECIEVVEQLISGERSLDEL